MFQVFDAGCLIYVCRLRHPVFPPPDLYLRYDIIFTTSIVPVPLTAGQYSKYMAFRSGRRCFNGDKWDVDAYSIAQKNPPRPGVAKNEIEAAKYYTLAADQAPWVHSIV